ncbi:MAG: hypothetical protein ACPGJV_10080 [Bacteriovoracaceae bacterium]
MRKFEADTLEEALKNIKHELGPDAIILKTITNTGLKGAFKKKKIEITAAISEKNYTDKAKVDNVLSEDQKSKFYNSPSSEISKQIDGFNKPETKGGYGNLSLNKTVKVKNKGGSSLDDFLGSEEKVQSKPLPNVIKPNTFEDEMRQVSQEELQTQETPRETPRQAPEPQVQEAPREVRNDISQEMISQYQSIIRQQDNRILELEKKLTELVSKVESTEVVNNSSLFELRQKFKALGLSEQIIQGVIARVSGELEPEELHDFDAILEASLNHLLNDFHTALPLYSNSDRVPTITMLVSEANCGQSSMARKVANLCPNSCLVIYGAQGQNSFVDQMLDLKVLYVTNPSEIITICRKNNEAGINTFIDYKYTKKDENFKKFVKGLKRSFEKVETLATISAIHDEAYNSKVLNLFRDIAGGVVVNFIDHCMDYGSLLNLNQQFIEMPFVFYGNGDVIPEDIEAATAERVLAGMFRIR